jgi:hypothetical protein
MQSCLMKFHIGVTLESSQTFLKQAIEASSHLSRLKQSPGSVYAVISRGIKIRYFNLSPFRILIATKTYRSTPLFVSAVTESQIYCEEVLLRRQGYREFQ